MRILQINCVYGNGSTGKLVESNSRILREAGYEMLTCYGNPPDINDGSSKRICSKSEHLFNCVYSRVVGIPFGGIFLSNSRVYKEIKSFKPDVVHVHCVNGQSLNIYNLLKYLGRNDIKTVVTLHAEFFHTGSCTHACECEKWKTECHDCSIYKYETASLLFNRANKAWKLMRDAFASFKPENIIITAVSPWLAERAAQSAILKNFRVEYVPNGVNTNLFHLSEPLHTAPFNNGKKTVLFVTPYFTLTKHLKGGYFIPEIAKRLPDYNFLIVASASDNNFEGMPENVHYFGRAKNQEELAQLYSSADLTLILSVRETFSMVTAESLCCGTPVVGFKAGGPESIALPDYSRFVNYGDINELLDRINEFNRNVPDKAHISKLSLSTYSEKIMAHEYERIYKKLQ